MGKRSALAAPVNRVTGCRFGRSTASVCSRVRSVPIRVSQSAAHPGRASTGPAKARGGRRETSPGCRRFASNRVEAEAPVEAGICVASGEARKPVAASFRSCFPRTACIWGQPFASLVCAASTTRDADGGRSRMPVARVARSGNVLVRPAAIRISRKAVVRVEPPAVSYVISGSPATRARASRRRLDRVLRRCGPGARDRRSVSRVLPRVLPW